MIEILIIVFIFVCLFFGKLAIDSRIAVNYAKAVNAKMKDENRQYELLSTKYRILVDHYNELVRNRNKLKEMYENAVYQDQTSFKSDFTKDELIAIRRRMHPDLNNGKYQDLVSKINSVLENK